MLKLIRLVRLMINLINYNTVQFQDI